MTRLVVDSSALALLINPQASPPLNPTTNALTDYVPERIEALIAGLSGTDVVIIPTPVLAEILVKAEDEAPAFLGKIQDQSRLRV
ncbi:MAG: hypothetical protein J0L50_10325 [Sphingomonadales bacterium]|nr:hypothetical protein [Sphingomonadales bacterium]